MRELSLYSGAGGGLLGTRLLGWRTVGFVERDPYCQEVIEARIQDGLFDSAPIFGDARRFLRDGWAGRYRGLVDVVSAGWPCQPHSLAGKRLASADERDQWPNVHGILREVQPRWFLGENVAGLLSSESGRYFGTVLRDLAALGFDAEWGVLGASDVGAPHRRKRLWIVAHTKDSDRGSELEAEGTGIGRTGSCGSRKLADAKRAGLEKRRSFRRTDAQECAPTERGGTLANSDERGCEGEWKPEYSNESSASRDCFDGCDSRRWRIWPSGRGEEQYEWEPDRTIKSGMGGGSNGVANIGHTALEPLATDRFPIASSRLGVGSAQDSPKMGRTLDLTSMENQHRVSP